MGSGGANVARSLLVVVFACAVPLVSGSGCASTWDTVSSRKFRESPMKTLFNNEDPMQVLRAKSDGSDRADAMRRLKEPASQGFPVQVQDEAIQILEKAATADPSPVVRTAAIDALGRFRDPRAVGVLISAYHLADGRPMKDAPKTLSALQPVAAQLSGNEPLDIGAPVGFPPEFVGTIRANAVASLAKFPLPDAIAFLGTVASGETNLTQDPDENRSVRSAAVRSLSQMRDKNAVVALAKVLKKDAGRDIVIAARAHEGLVNLTGQKLPPEPAKWDALVQTNFQVVPEPNAVQRAIHSVVP